MIKDKKIRLNNNKEMPIIGFGTWQIKNEEVCDIVLFALENGYRHIDTAIVYGNEEGVGKALKKTTISREEIYVTSKIPAEVKSYEEAKRCIDESLNRLQLDYLDLMLIHAPRPWEDLINPDAPRLYKENLDVYRALEEAYTEGKIKSIGVSNFYLDDMRNILNNVNIKPVVNQIYVCIKETPFELISYCHENGVDVQAYSPIATGRLLNNEEVALMAKKYNVSIAQLCIKYCLNLNTIPLPRSTNKEHIKSNLDLDFEISNEDMEKLKKL